MSSKSIIKLCGMVIAAAICATFALGAVAVAVARGRWRR